MSQIILKKIYNEIRNESKTISLIPSENVMSALAVKMYATRSNGRYLLPINVNQKHFMPGRENLESITVHLEAKLCSIYGCKYTVTKGLSGLHQMDIVMSSMKKLTNNIILLDKFNGGHSKTAAIAKENNYNVAYLTLEFENWDIDYARLAILTEKWKDEVVFIYIDHTVVLNPLNIHKLLSKIPPQWITYYDISHLQLFYFSKTFTFPAKSNFFFGGSTHKSFPGPQKAIILLNNSYLHKTIKSGFESAVSSTHTGSILALLITVIEMEKYGAEYAKDIIDKTRLFAKKLSEKLKVIGPSPYLTNTHQICIAVKDPMEVTKRLASVGIITAPSRIPLVESIGLRLGIQEHCRFGINERILIRLAEIISSCIGKNGRNTFKMKQEVEQIAKSLTRVKYILNTSQVLQLMEQ